MPFNGSGTFNRLYSWVIDAANDVDISSSRTDAEMNGFAAGLTNCITRDGQSPPSADIPWGGKRLTNLGAATTDTDALNRITGDGRYMQSAFALTFNNGGAGIASGSAFNGSASITVSYNSIGAAPLASPTFTGTPAAPTASVGTNTTQLATTAFVLANSAPLASPVFTGTPTAPTPTLGDNSTKLATTAYVLAAGFATLASPTFTGTPAAPTPTAGDSSTKIATTAFVDGLRDVPSNAQTVSYTLALSDRGKGVDFNGTSLTCTIPANSSVAFPVGSVVVLTNLNSSNLSVAITTDTLTMAGTTTTGTRTLSQNGVATLRKVGTTSWLISGVGLS